MVAGAGALGTCYAAMLAEAGAEVTVLVRPQRLDTFPRELRVSGLVEKRAQVTVVASGTDVGRVDYLLLTTKARDTDGALEALQGCEPEAAFSLQNGLQKNEALIARFGRERVLGAACVVGAGLDEPGHALLTMNQATWVGELGDVQGSKFNVQSAPPTQRVVRLVAALRAAGFPSWSVQDAAAVEWYKVCALIPGAVVTALSRRAYDEMALHPELSRLFVRVMRETFSVPQALDYEIQDPPGALWEFGKWLPEPDEVALAGLRAIGERQRAAGQKVQPSMLQDLLAGRRTEAEEVLAPLIARARELGVAVPAVETAYQLVRGTEDGF
jgi:2-dehydropantoate 2-reductase